MASEKQIAANRRNAVKSTGPKSSEGKARSRRNAIRHGLTAHTVIAGLESRKEYAAFESTFIAEYAPQLAIEHELVARLASLLWRLRRANAIESGLLAIQAEIQRERRELGPTKVLPLPPAITRLLNDDQNPTMTTSADLAPVGRSRTSADRAPARPRWSGSRHLARSFLRLANLDDGVFERLGRYEAMLWRQAAQTLVALDAVRSCFPFPRPALEPDNHKEIDVRPPD